MSRYTMELREYIEMWSQDNLDTMLLSDVIEAGRPKLFDFTYPIYDPDGSYKKFFETLFIKTFYMTEIGFETEGLFKLALDRWLNTNMGYFNQLLESAALTYNVLENVNTSASQSKDTTNSNTIDGTSSGTGTQNTNGTKNQTLNDTESQDNFDRQLESLTPDDRLSITATDGQGLIEYANQINENTANNSTNRNTTDDITTTGNTSNSSSETSNVSSNGSQNETATDTVTGKTGSITYAEMVQKHRATFLRIEKQIFDECRKALFMLIY